MKNDMFQSPREFAKRGIKSEREVRREIAQGIVPGFWAGSRFVIDAEAYIFQIRGDCLRNAGKEASTRDSA